MVASLVKLARLERGLTQEQLALAAGCAQSEVSKLERGGRPPTSAALLTRLEVALGLAPGELAAHAVARTYRRHPR